MQPFIIHVRVQAYEGMHMDIQRYVVLAESADEALASFKSKLAFGDRALISDEVLSPEQAKALALVAGAARLIT